MIIGLLKTTDQNTILKRKNMEHMPERHNSNDHFVNRIQVRSLVNQPDVTKGKMFSQLQNFIQLQLPHTVDF